MAENARDRVLINDARLVFRNFAGKEGRFNVAGQRNFCVLLPFDVADELRRNGWSVKELKPREEGDAPQPYLQVAVKYRDRFGSMLRRSPRVVLITEVNGERRRTDLGESEINILDWAEIRHVDLSINPRTWSDGNGDHIKAYLHSIYVTIEMDELEQKYIDVPDSGQSATTYEREDPPWDED